MVLVMTSELRMTSRNTEHSISRHHYEHISR